MKVLCVDDEPNVLEGLERTLGEEFAIETATSGEAALALLEGGGFSTIVSDMRMPGMNGAQLLAKARAAAPNVTRIMLTGQSDVDAAIAAVNEGAIFRFLQKPCPSQSLRATITAAVEQHRLVVAERELIDGTLRGIVKLLTDVLAVAAPTVFARSGRLREIVLHAAPRLGIADTWQVEIAALLSQLGCIALPDDVIARASAGQELTDHEAAQLADHPQTGARLLAEIPRLREVSEMIAIHHTVKAPAGPSPVEMGAALLRCATELDDLKSRGLSRVDALDKMRLRPMELDRRVIEALESFRSAADRWSEQGLPISQLSLGMVTEEDVVSLTGSVLMKKGTELTTVTLERLRRFADGAGVREPIRVRVGH